MRRTFNFNFICNFNTDTSRCADIRWKQKWTAQVRARTFHVMYVRLLSTNMINLDSRVHGSQTHERVYTMMIVKNEIVIVKNPIVIV